jgi:hypothetical protein
VKADVFHKPFDVLIGKVDGSTPRKKPGLPPVLQGRVADDFFVNVALMSYGFQVREYGTPLFCSGFPGLILHLITVYVLPPGLICFISVHVGRIHLLGELFPGRLLESHWASRLVGRSIF